MKRPGLLFVSHDATRTGAPMALLHFLRWYKRNGDRPFAVLLPKEGELLPDFEEVADTWPIDRSRWSSGGRRAFFLNRIGLGALARRTEIAEIRRVATRCSPGLIYKNSVSSCWADMLPAEIPVLTHVHELEFGFRRSPRSHVERLMAETRQFIACSEAVKRNLALREGVPAELIETVHESIPVGEIRAEKTREEVLRELKLPNDALLVVGSGTPDWRKGSDLFLQLAREVTRQRPRAHFAWVGGGWSPDPERFENDIRHASLADKVRLTGWVKQPADYFGAADVFALTSREDPYPLVCLEAAALSKPIVCFADAGGMPEFVEDDCGFVVPYLDVRGMAERVIYLLDSAECRLKMGAAARRKVAERHDISIGARRIMKIIERTIAGE